jgi:hypothetical protein
LLGLSRRGLSTSTRAAIFEQRRSKTDFEKWRAALVKEIETGAEWRAEKTLVDLSPNGNWVVTRVKGYELG